MMRLSRFFAAQCAVGAALFFGAGCGSGGGNSPAPIPIATANNSPISAEEYYENFVLTTKIPKRVFSRGEAVPITVTVQNVGTTDATFTFGTPGFSFDGSQAEAVSLPVNGWISLIKGKTSEKVRILSQTAPPSSGVNYSTLRTFTLPAGQSQTVTLEWNQISSEASSAGAAYTQVAPGSYQIAPYLPAYSLNGVNMPNGPLITLGQQIEIQ